MKLSDASIRSYALHNGMIQPFHEGQLQPSSYDVTLGRYILVQDDLPPDVVALDLRVHDPKKYMTKVDISRGYVLHPGECVLASTNEKLVVPRDIVAQVDGKSSLGRIFLAIHVTAGYIDPEFTGTITLEIVNLNPKWPIWLYQDMAIGQFSFTLMDGKAEAGYGSDRYSSHYQDQQDVTAAVGERAVSDAGMPRGGPTEAIAGLDLSGQVRSRPGVNAPGSAQDANLGEIAASLAHRLRAAARELMHQDTLWERALPQLPTSSFIGGSFTEKFRPRERIAETLKLILDNED